jgi:hypothetical protein
VHYETWNTGVGGPVVLHGLDEGSRDLTWQTWSYQVCLTLHALVNDLLSRKKLNLFFSMLGWPERRTDESELHRRLKLS